MRLTKLKFLCFALLLALISCTSSDNITKERFSKANAGKGDIVIGVVWPESKLNSDFKAGIDMALEEVNSEGLMNGRRMRVIFKDNKGDKEVNRRIAQSFAKNTNMIAVFGHFYSSFALPSSVTYQENGLMFITPGSLLLELSLHGFDLFFRTIPNTYAIGTSCARYTYKLGFNKPIVLWERSVYGKSMFHIYKEYLAKLGIDVNTSFSYFSLEEDYRNIIAEMKNLDFDLVFMAVSSSDAPFFIKEARNHSVKAPFFGINLVDEVLVKHAGEHAHDIYTISNFDPNSDFPPTVEFVKKFKEKYNQEPDVWGAQGYDGIKLLAFLIDKFESTHPEILASNLRYLENWEGATGLHTFSRRGEVYTKPLYLNEMIDGQFHKIEIETLQEVDLYRVYNKELLDEIDKGYLMLHKVDDVKVVIIPDVSIFTGLQYEISDLGNRILNVLIEELNKQPEHNIEIEGFTDITFLYDNTKSKSDLILDGSLTKASKIAKKMYDSGFPKSRITVIGQGVPTQSKYVRKMSGKKSFDNRIEIIITPLMKRNGGNNDDSAKEKAGGAKK